MKNDGKVMYIQFIVDCYVMKGCYCWGSLFFNLSCWSKFIIFRFIVLLTKDL